jgi:hypothetical protein
MLDEPYRAVLLGQGVTEHRLRAMLGDCDGDAQGQ